MNERLAQELNALRGRYNLSQTELGAVIGVTQSQMSKRLKGGVPFTLDEVETLARYFSMTPMQLLGEAESPRPNGPGAPSLLPRLDSNQQPSDFTYAQVSGLRAA
jgi:transcriptional regulator with XRE-family HTH domain